MSGSALARDLAAGTPPWESPRHAARALQITADSYRAGVARSLEHLVAAAQRPPCRLDPVPVCRPQIREASDWLLLLAARLRAKAPVDPRGMAMLSELLGNGTSPCYAHAAPGALTRALHAAGCWLEVED